ncbi:cyanophycin synthetase [Pseudalkalibacillus berkeleyi]|uniref:Cyanophycin synthetase n=1 Tax=Pseudalkalibacillus berkeleyi TaxID=1069813 RepID=A0ABS9H6G3_9BACL|nr:cyanophycin synthetase [Pseudalkalibacillus berkeleyi]MCF6139385.1 cyanophycin synthetase [Pseudalkalibacillus berkeleyi]
MKINKVKYLTGPNYYSYKPTIWLELDIGKFEEMPSNEIPHFTDRLLETMPTLYTHTCSRGYEGGFVERLKEGTWMGHILEHMAIELQSLAGIDVKRGKTVTSDRKGIYYVTYRYEEKKSGIYAFEAAMEIVYAVLDGQAISLDPFIKKIEDLYYANKLGPSTEALYHAAYERKIPVQQLGDECVLQLGTGRKQKRMEATMSSQTSFLSVEYACDKEMTKSMLKGVSLPVPEGSVITTEEELLEEAESLGFPLVIKPINGRQGQGVCTNIRSIQELKLAYAQHKNTDQLIVERYYSGDDYRFTIVDGKMVAVSLRLPPYVIGNGKDTIKTLIEKENENPLRGNGHEKPMTKIPMNESVQQYLKHAGLDFHSIIENGQVIHLLGNANLSTGGLAIDVTDEVHPSYRTIAESSAKTIGLDIAGVDMIIEDINAEYKPGRAAVLEVNAAPGIRMHHHPSSGTPRDVGGAIVDYLFEDYRDAAIPTVAVTGTNGKTTTVRLISHFLQQKGKIVGMAHSDGVYIGKQCIDKGDCSGPVSARKVLNHPEVDAAVLETARGGMLREGTAFRYCDVGIVTNVSEDHLGLDGIETLEELIKLKRLIPEIVHPDGYCILNADDAAVAEMAGYTKGSIVYTSMTADNPIIQKHVSKHGECWYVDEDWIVHAKDGQTMRLMKYADIPITFNGHAKHNVSNLLQALASAHLLGVSDERLCKKVLTFFPDFLQSPGRFNKIDQEGRTIIVDYAHNTAGLKAVYDTIRSIPCERIITAVSAPGDRLDEDIRNMGEIIGKETHIVVIKEDGNLRGRKPKEVASILEEVLSDKIPSDRRILELDERKAFQVAWETSRPGDLLLFLYDSFSSIEHFFKENKKQKRLLTERKYRRTSYL